MKQLIALIFGAGIFLCACRKSDDMVSISTAAGERRTIELPDGSTVMLNGESSIRYKSSFDRKIAITGEAYVTVKASKGATFVSQFIDGQVETEQGEYNLDAYEAGRKQRYLSFYDFGTKVMVYQGRATVRGERDRMALNRREGCVVGILLSPLQWLPDRDLRSWTLGYYYLRMLYLHELRDVIRRTYGKTLVWKKDYMVDEDTSDRLYLDFDWDMEGVIQVMNRDIKHLCFEPIGRDSIKVSHR